MLAWFKDPTHLALVLGWAYALLSEAIPLLPTKATGVVHALLLVLKSLSDSLTAKAAIVLPFLAAALLSLPGCAWVKKVAVNAEACAGPAVQKEVENLLPAVLAILASGSADWQAQLQALESVGLQALLCTVQSVVDGAQARIASGKAGLDYPGMVLRGKQFLLLYGAK